MNYFKNTYAGAAAAVSLFDVNRREAQAVVTPTDPNATAAEQIARLGAVADELSRQLGMKPVFERWLLSDATNQSLLIPDRTECARSVVQQPPLDGHKAALVVFYQDNSTFRHIGNGVWQDDNNRFWVGDNDAIPAADSRTMTMEYLDRLDRVLVSSGGSLADSCVRTWFFVRDVDNNYSGVVDGRNRVFDRCGLTPDTHFIASTGIAGSCADTARTTAFNAYADTSLHSSQIKYLYGATHLNPTYEYGVAFERGTATDYGDRRHVYISGTASIDNKGNIVAPGDISAQTARMLENIGVLLAEAECSPSDIAHLIVYLRDIADAPVVETLIARFAPNVPTAIVWAPVCRPGWLIEAECIAIKPIDNPANANF